MADDEKPAEGDKSFDWDDFDGSGDAGAGDAGDGSDDAPELTDAEREAEALLAFKAEADAAKEKADADFKAQYEEALRKSPDYQPPPPELTTIEKAAQAASALTIEQMQEFTETMRQAVRERERKRLAGTEGFDLEGSPVAPPEPPFNPASLDGEGFNIFMAAAARGGADPQRTPAGFTGETWAKAVDSALGVSR